MTYVNSLFYVKPFLVSLCISAILCYCIIIISYKWRFRDVRDEERHIHQRNISRFGGIAVIIAFVSTLYFNQYLIFDRLIWAMIIGSMLILFVGIIDDIKPLSWKSQLFFQVMLVLIVFIFGIRIEYITNPLGDVFWLINSDFVMLSFGFMLVWMIFVMNAINWSDGIDGLSGGVVCVSAFTLFIISLRPEVMQPPIAIISVVLAGSVFGFLIFNFPRAKIFVGSSGAFFMGFILALSAIAAGAKIGTTLLVLAVPLIDALWVIVRRVREGRSIFHGDREHAHHKLLERGWSVKKILLLYYGATILSAIAAVTTQSINKLMIFVVLCFVLITFFIIISYENKVPANE